MVPTKQYEDQGCVVFYLTYRRQFISVNSDAEKVSLEYRDKLLKYKTQLSICQEVLTEQTAHVRLRDTEKVQQQGNTSTTIYDV